MPLVTSTPLTSNYRKLEPPLSRAHILSLSLPPYPVSSNFSSHTAMNEFHGFKMPCYLHMVYAENLVEKN